MSDRLTIVNPVAIPEGHTAAAVTFPLAPRPKSLDGLRVGLFWNGKNLGDVALQRTEVSLGKLYEGATFQHYLGDKGGLQRYASPPLQDKILAECDVLVGTTADCGSCTSWLMREMAAFEERGLPTVIGRMFNTVGPRQTGRYGMVVPNFVRQALAGQPITVFGDGTQTRCFCHVHDVVRALADLMERDDLYGEVFNIGAEEEISIADLAARVREIVGNDVPITYIPYDEAYEEGFEDMHRRVPDISKIGSVLGWAPTKSLEQIVRDVEAHQLETTQLSALAA